MDKFDLDIILFTHGPGAYAPKRLVEESVKSNTNLRVIKYNDLNIKYNASGLELSLNNGTLPTPRGIFLRGLGEDNVYNSIRVAIIKWFTARNVKIINAESFMEWPSLDKTLQYINMAERGIPIVESFSFTSKNDFRVWSQNSYPFIAKDIIGSNGTGVFKIVSDADLQKLFENFKSNYKIKNLLFQRFLPNASDLRVIVLGGNILGAMKRTALPGNFLSNYSQGGSVEMYPIDNDPEATKVTQKTAELFKLDYGGIDLMKNEKGNWVVLEVNRACQFEGFEKATGINVASKIIDFLMK